MQISSYPLSKETPRLRFLRQGGAFCVSFAVDVLGIEPRQIDFPEQFGEDHAHLEVCEAVRSMSYNQQRKEETLLPSETASRTVGEWEGPV